MTTLRALLVELLDWAAVLGLVLFACVCAVLVGLADLLGAITQRIAVWADGPRRS